MLLNVIYNDNQPERFEPLMNELMAQGIHYRLWPPVEAKTAVESINLTHKSIVRAAKILNLSMVAIAEDDIMFPAKDGWQYFLSKTPKEFDIYSAATYVDDLENKNHLCGFHLYVVRSNFYEKFLSVPDGSHIDTAIDELGGNFVVCRPFAALQRPFRSANHPEIPISNYNLVVKKEDIYYGDTTIYNV